MLPDLNGAEFVGEVGMPYLWFDASHLLKDTYHGHAGRTPDSVCAAMTGVAGERNYTAGEPLDFWSDTISGTNWVPLHSDAIKGYVPRLLQEIHPKTGAQLTFVRFNNSRMYAPEEQEHIGYNGRANFGTGDKMYQTGCGPDAATAPGACINTRAGATNSVMRLPDNHDFTIFFVMRPRSIAEYGSDFLQRFFGHYPSGQFRILDKKPSMYANKRSFTSALEIKLDEWVIVSYRIEDFNVAGTASTLKSVDILTSNTMNYELSFIFNKLSAYITNGKPADNDGESKKDTDMDCAGRGCGMVIGGVHLRADGATAATQNGITDDGYLGDIAEIVYYNNSLTDVQAKKVVLLLFRKWIGGEGKSAGKGYVEVGPGGVPGLLLHLAPDEKTWAQNTSISRWGSTNKQFHFKAMVNVDDYANDPLVADGSFSHTFQLVNAPGGFRALRFNGHQGMYTTELQLTAYEWTMFFVMRPRGEQGDMAWNIPAANLDGQCNLVGSGMAGSVLNTAVRKKATGYASSPNPDAYGWVKCKQTDNQGPKVGCRTHSKQTYKIEGSGNSNRFFGHYSYGQFRWSNGRPSVYTSGKSIVAPVCAKLDEWGILAVTFGMKAEPTLVNVTWPDGTNHSVWQDKLHYTVKFLYGTEGMSTYNDTRNPWEATDASMTRAKWQHDKSKDFLEPPTFFDPSPLGVGTQGAPPGHNNGPMDPKTGLLRKNTAFFGDIAEILVFQRTLSEDEGNTVYETLHAKYFAPTPSPTPLPTESPTDSPTESPTEVPTASVPTRAPTPKPTNSPTESPTYSPTFPTQSPTPSPSYSPTFPTPEPTYDWGQTAAPTPSPSLNISQLGTGSPTISPTHSPTIATLSPTMLPTLRPTFEWEKYMPPPTPEPTGKPMTPWPTYEPTTPYPTPAPSMTPTTETPTVMPVPTPVPTFPTRSPTPAPSVLYAYKRMVGWVGVRLTVQATCAMITNMTDALIETMNVNIGLGEHERTINVEVLKPFMCKNTGGGRRLLGSGDDESDIVQWHWDLVLINEQATITESHRIAKDISTYFGLFNGGSFVGGIKSRLRPEAIGPQGPLKGVGFECAEGLAWIECATCNSQYGDLQCSEGSTIYPTSMPTSPTPGPTPHPTYRPTSPTREPTTPTPQPTALGGYTESPTFAPVVQNDNYNAEADPASPEFWAANWWILMLSGICLLVLCVVIVISVLACIVATYIARKKQRSALRNLKGDELRENRMQKMGRAKKHKGQVNAERIVAAAKERRASLAMEENSGIEMKFKKNPAWATKEESTDESFDSGDRWASKEAEKEAESWDSPTMFNNPLDAMRSKPKFSMEKSAIEMPSLSNARGFSSQPKFSMEKSSRFPSSFDTQARAKPSTFDQVNPLAAMRAAQATAKAAATTANPMRAALASKAAATPTPAVAAGDSDLHLRLRTAVQKRKVRNANANVKAIAAFESTRARVADGAASGQMSSVRNRLQAQRDLLLAKVHGNAAAAKTAANAPAGAASAMPRRARGGGTGMLAALPSLTPVARTQASATLADASAPYRSSTFDSFMAAMKQTDGDEEEDDPDGIGFSFDMPMIMGTQQQTPAQKLAAQRANIMKFSKRNQPQTGAAAGAAPARLQTLSMPAMGRLQDLRSQIQQPGAAAAPGAAPRMQAMKPLSLAAFKKGPGK